MNHDYEKSLNEAMARIIDRINARVNHLHTMAKYELENYMWEKSMWRGMGLW